MKIHPAPGRLLVRRLKQSETTKGGLIVAETSRQELPLGEVLECGACRDTRDEEVFDFLTGVKTILFHELAATKVDIPGEEVYYLLEYPDVIGRMEE